MDKVATINYRLDDDLHRRAKIAAATQGIALKQLLIEGLELAIAQAETGPKRR